MRPRNPMGRIIHSLCFLTDKVSSIRYTVEPTVDNHALRKKKWSPTGGGLSWKVLLTCVYVCCHVSTKSPAYHKSSCLLVLKRLDSES